MPAADGGQCRLLTEVNAAWWSQVNAAYSRASLPNTPLSIGARAIRVACSFERFANDDL
jgi:hypothetical protein